MMHPMSLLVMHRMPHCGCQATSHVPPRATAGMNPEHCVLQMLGGGAMGQQPGRAQPAGPSGRQSRSRHPTAQVIDDSLPELEELPEDVAAHWRSVIM